MFKEPDSLSRASERSNNLVSYATIAEDPAELLFSLSFSLISSR